MCLSRSVFGKMRGWNKWYGIALIPKVQDNDYNFFENWRLLAHAADFVVIMAVDESYFTPGPAVSLPWLKRLLTYALQTMPESVGFVGLGIMGKPMAHNLLKAGFPLVVQNRHRENTDEFLAAGARAATRLRDIASSCDVVITMLPGRTQVKAVLVGPGGIIEGGHAAWRQEMLSGN